MYTKELLISNAANGNKFACLSVDQGYTDIEANIDLSSFRRIPWEDNIPFFLVFRICPLHWSEVFFADSKSHKPSNSLWICPNIFLVCACPRSLLRETLKGFVDIGCTAKAGIEYEFCKFIDCTCPDRNRSLWWNTPKSFRKAGSWSESNICDTFSEVSSPWPLECMDIPCYGRLLIRSISPNYSIYAASLEFTSRVCTPKRDLVFLRSLWLSTVNVVLDLILIIADAAEIADRAALFKLASKQIGSMHGIVPSFMAKPHAGLPGTSGHIHISLVDPTSGENLFARKEEDMEAEWTDIKHLSDIGRYL